MWASMCTLNIAGAYRPTPDEVANRTVKQPSTQATVRPTGQESPRLRSLRTPSR